MWTKTKQLDQSHVTETTDELALGKETIKDLSSNDRATNDVRGGVAPIDSAPVKLR